VAARLVACSAPHLLVEKNLMRPGLFSIRIDPAEIMTRISHKSQNLLHPNFFSIHILHENAAKKTQQQRFITPWMES
jgi:hypothetical protein